MLMLMLMPTPQLSYDTSTRPVIAQGVSYQDDQVSEMLAGPVKHILQDTAGNEELLGTLPSTEFEQEGLRQALTDGTVPDNWRVGEAIAEAFVVHKGNCVFPWPTGRDLKNPNASPAGCDLTGFQPVEDAEYPYRFAFGEVKTSKENKAPPSVMTSLGNQLFGLRDNSQVKHALVRYLRHRTVGASWKSMFESAATRYFRSKTTDIAIYGVLVRDIAPSASDIAGRAKALAANCPEKTDIEIYALYLPLNLIDTLSTRAQAAMQEAL